MSEPRGDGADDVPSVEPQAPMVAGHPGHPSEPRVINIPLIPSDPAPRPEEMFGPAAPPSACGAPPADSIGSTPASSHAVAFQDSVGTKLFLGGLNYDTEEQGLRAYFGKWGTVTDCLVLRDRETEKSRGARPATQGCHAWSSRPPLGPQDGGREGGRERASSREMPRCLGRRTGGCPDAGFC
mgnify:CR=1 FL=1